MSSLIGSSPSGRGSGLSAGKKKIGGYDVASLSRLSPEQQDLFSRLMGGSTAGAEAGLGQLSRLASGDEEQFKQLEAPAMRQFGQLQGQLGSRFSGFGGGALSARGGSGFQNAANSASVDLAERLQSNRMGLQQGAIQQLLGMSQSLLGRDTQENYLIPPKQSAWQRLLAGLGGGLSQGAGAFGTMYGAKKFGF